MACCCWRSFLSITSCLGFGRAGASFAEAGVATLLFVVASPVFQHYISQYAAGRYNAIYGSMWIVIVVLIWVWIVALVTIFGGEMASHTQKIAIDGESPKNVQRRHEARSAVKSSGN